MKVLFVAHHPFGRTRTRTEHLASHLAERMEVHVLTFSVERPWRDIGRFQRLLAAPLRNSEGVWIHELLRFPRMRRLNGRLLTDRVRQLVGRHNLDVVVISPNQYMVGSLDIESVGVPVVCDYLDGFDWSEGEQYPQHVALEKEYVKKAAAVVCITDALLRQASTENRSCHYIPNGVDLDHYRDAARTLSAANAKAALGLDPSAAVVSIIGLTCSSTLYFVDAVRQLREQGMNVQLALVGEGPIRLKIQERSRGCGEWIHDFGRVPYAEIMPYFAATDIGLYPVDDHSYYHFASPLKVFEYAAMGKPVIISPRLRELSRIALANFVFCECSAEALASTIQSVLRDAERSIFDPRISQYSWSVIAGEFSRVLHAVSSRLPDPEELETVLHSDSKTAGNH